MQPLAARGFDERREPDVFEEAADEMGRLDDLLELDALAWIEIEDHLVGLFEIGAPVAAPGMKLDDAELGECEVALGVLDRDIFFLLALLRAQRRKARDGRRHAGEGVTLE